MKKVSAAVKLFLIVLSTLVLYSVYAVGLLFIRLKNGRFEKWRNRTLFLWGKTVLRLMSVKVDVEGTPPEPPFFLVTNHLSYLDVCLLSSLLKTTYVAKSEVQTWPFLGPMAKNLGIIFIDRKRKRDVTRVNREVSEQINDLQGVVLFPEGMTSPGEKIYPFRPSLLEHPASEEIEVHYAAIHYRTEAGDVPAHRSICWWGKTSLPKHMFLMAQNRKGIATVTFGDNKISKKDRKELAKSLQSEVEKIFKPVVEEDTQFVPVNH